MNNLDQILEFNKQFVDTKLYEKYTSEKIPSKKMAILSCMDTRLTNLLPAALNLKNGDAKIIKNAGAIVNHPYGSVMRSLLVCVYELGVNEILVIGHEDCGMQAIEPTSIIDKFKSKGISEEVINTISYGIDIEDWFHGFDDLNTSIIETVTLIRNHPLLPKNILVNGLTINPTTGKLRKII